MENDTFEKDVLNRPATFRYRMLSRFITDAKYYMDHPSPRVLWSGDAKEHAENMIRLYDSFSADEAPEWVSRPEILDYARALYESVGETLREGKSAEWVDKIVDLLEEKGLFYGFFNYPGYDHRLYVSDEPLNGNAHGKLVLRGTYKAMYAKLLKADLSSLGSKSWGE